MLVTALPENLRNMTRQTANSVPSRRITRIFYVTMQNKMIYFRTTGRGRSTSPPRPTVRLHPQQGYFPLLADSGIFLGISNPWQTVPIGVFYPTALR
jgi:hypothetical protein